MRHLPFNTAILLAACCLAVLHLAVHAQRDDGTFSFPRGRKPYGSLCYSDEECYTNFCGYDQYTDSTACIRQWEGGRCYENDMCGSRNCTSGRCVGSPPLGPCDDAYDCHGTNFTDVPQFCQTHQCFISEGFPCERDEQCGPGTQCLNGQCRRASQAPNSQCSVDAECASNRCLNSTQSPYCYDSDGRLQDECYYDRHCDRFPLGHACGNDGDCAQGFCRNSTCVAGKNGSPCVSDTQCTDKNALCGSGGKCISPAPGSLYPQEHCYVDAHCFSGRCSKRLNVTDKYDVSAFYFDGDVQPAYSAPEPLRCAYLKPGQSKCRTFVDCDPGLCKSGVCALGTNGDECLYNQHCQSVCGLDGRCYAPRPDRSLPIGEPCSSAEQCFSAVCETGTLSRPVPGSGGGGAGERHSVSDTVCMGANLDGPCARGSDCAQGACRSGTCQLLREGESCESGSQCYSTSCAPSTSTPPSPSQPSSSSDSNTGSSKTCRALDARQACSENGQCFSQRCSQEACTGTGSSNACADRSTCAAVSTGGACRSTSDCRTNAVCAPDGNGGGGGGVGGRCKLQADETCSSDEACLSNACVGRKCARKATSASGKGVAKSTTTTTTATRRNPTSTPSAGNRTSARSSPGAASSRA
ncbi:hypothetical protein OC842_006178 [Tilletia horrida]|uniref:Dickkopf N-terminal cysteine-rich domain-containing protein n=1 Tax=Tilletia horrida TaxID=155126 RepID=A0AAN6G7R4_9BASI|nr:hypothetical protein OC842_006178 [Tilletia horrida]